MDGNGIVIISVKEEGNYSLNGFSEKVRRWLYVLKAIRIFIRDIAKLIPIIFKGHLFYRNLMQVLI